MTNPTPCEWRVFVHTNGVGDIGSVTESTETLARLAALSKYGVEFERDNPTLDIIYCDDEFDVRPA